MDDFSWSVPRGYLVSVEVAEIIDAMDRRGFENCTLAELERVVYHVAMLNEHYRPHVLDTELEPA